MTTTTLTGTETYAAPHTSALLLIARLALAYIFVPSGFGKLMGLSGFADHLAGMGVPSQYSFAVAVAAGLVEFLGSLLIVFGLATRPVAVLMAIFTVATGFMAHRYWAATEPAQIASQTIQFNKNIAIAGGFLALAAAGAGRWSLDGRRGGG